jgi:hypothetical protein
MHCSLRTYPKLTRTQEKALEIPTVAEVDDDGRSTPVRPAAHDAYKVSRSKRVQEYYLDFPGVQRPQPSCNRREAGIHTIFVNTLDLHSRTHRSHLVKSWPYNVNTYGASTYTPFSAHAHDHSFVIRSVVFSDHIADHSNTKPPHPEPSRGHAFRV